MPLPPPVRHAVLWDHGTAIDLGTFGGETSEAYAINNLGQVVGMAYAAGGVPHAFLWENGTMKDLGAYRIAYDINDAGQVAGRSSVFPGRAWVLERGVVTTLPTLGGVDSGAAAINNRGQVTGSSAITDGPGHAFLWDKGVMVDLGSLDVQGVSFATDINNRGQVTGGGYNGSSAAIVWTDGDMKIIHAPTGGYLEFRGINDAGRIAGSLSTEEHTHAVVIDLR